jgi:S1-C subfamily serine protease
MTQQSIPGSSKLIYVIIAAVAAGFIGGLGASWLMLSSRAGAPAPAWQAVPPAIAAPDVSGGPASFAPVARAVMPSVVNIDTVVRQRVSPFGGTPFGDFFGRDPFEEVVLREGSASGVIVRSDGYILTNQHVVENSRSIVVTLADHRQFDAQVVGADRPSDLAVVRIAADGLQAAVLGDSSTVEPGDWVVAIGNPFGFQHTITVGVVSALGRPIYVPEERRRYEDLIQTDANINRGNSGGPLVDERGRVIGINTAVVAGPEAAPMGFAIPINSATRIKDEIIARGRVSRSWIGVNFADVVTPQLARHYGLPTDHGVIVADATEGGPAAAAGLSRNDIVVQINDTQMTDIDQALQLIVTAPVGSKLNLRIWRPTPQRWEQHVVPIVTQEAPAPAAPGR